MTTPRTPLLLESVDDFLGPRESRFFGEGHKRVRHSLTDIRVTPAAEGGTIEARAGLKMLGSWSRKDTAEQRPHLSTLDVMLLGARLGGLYLRHANGPGTENGFLVRGLAIRAGSEPYEDGLATFPVTGRHTAAGESPAGRLDRLDCRIGTMTVQVETASGAAAGPGPTGPARYASTAELPGPWNSAPFGGAHHDRRQSLTSVLADPAMLSAEADLTVTETAPGAATAGGPAVAPTMIDVFVAALQLGQVVLYLLDGVSRAASDTLWMRRTRIGPAPNRGGKGRFRVTLQEPRLLTDSRGTWRSADIVTTTAGLALRCSVAHLLPRGAGARPAPP